MTSRATLVESLPAGLFEPPRSGAAAGHSTASALLRLTEAAQETIDLTAMYWSLLHDPQRADEAGFPPGAITALQTEPGRALYHALGSAAARGVRIRIVQSPGFDGLDEVEALTERFPDRVEARTLNMRDWFGGGIMHQKLWLFDRRHFYVGSANMDWRALTQVKELGVVVEDDPPLAEDLLRLYEAWWRFAALEPAPVADVYDPQIGLSRPVPGWSSLLAREGVAQTPSPFADPALAARSSLDDPLPVSWNGAAGRAFLTASPPELCPAGRTFDLDALLYTAATARERLSISVMHFTPLEWPRHAPRSAAIWWPRLQDALLRAYLRGVQVRLLVSRWPHSHPSMLALTSALQQTARAIGAAERESSASSDKREMQQGSLQVRAFTMPGWDETTGPERRYPGHSRVNHAKYMVSERRVNVGTSNMGWHDFYLNAGISLNSDHPGLVHDLQALFDRDWRSAYAIPVEALQESSM